MFTSFTFDNNTSTSCTVASSIREALVDFAEVSLFYPCFPKLFLLCATLNVLLVNLLSRQLKHDLFETAAIIGSSFIFIDLSWIECFASPRFRILLNILVPLELFHGLCTKCSFYRFVPHVPNEHVVVELFLSPKVADSRYPFPSVQNYSNVSLSFCFLDRTDPSIYCLLSGTLFSLHPSIAGYQFSSSLMLGCS